MAKISKGTIGLLGEIVSLLHGAVASGLRLVNNLVSSGFKMAFQFNDSAMAFSRQAGLTAKQAQAYTEVLTTRAKELGEKYGIAAEEVTKLERNLAKATGRVIMLSSAQADMQVAINRTVGEQTADEFSQIMMRTMGAGISTVQGAVSKAYATAAKNGLDAAGMAAKVAQNLSMANRLTFKNGVDGLTKMVALSEKFGINVQTIESAANSFMDLQDAIESSAKLTMLGGSIGGLGGNPLDMTYEANADPEAFAERLTKMAGGYAQFDAKTGMAKLNYMSRDMLKGMADALHVSLDEMVGMAKKQAELTYKNNRFGADLNRLTGGDQKKIDFFLNKAQYNPAANNGRGGLVMTDRSGQERDVKYFLNDKNGKKELEEMMKFNKMTDEEIVREQAEAVVSIRERLEGYFTTIQGLFAEKIKPFMPQIQKFLGDIYHIMFPHFREIADNVKKLIGTLFMPENLGKVKDGISALVGFVSWFGKLFTSNWKWLIGGALLAPLLGAVTWGFNQILLYRGRNGVGTPAAGGSTLFSGFRNTYQAALQAPGYSKWGAAKFAMNGTKLGTGITRGGGILGAIGAGIGTYNAISDYNDKESEIRNRSDLSTSEKASMIKEAARERNNEVGAAVGAGAGVGIGTWLGGILGTMVAPGVGTAIGAAAGSAIGGWLGGAGGKAIVNAVQGTSKGSYPIEGVHNGGVNTPTSGARSVVSDDFRDVANGVKKLSVTEPGESFVTPAQRENINEWIKAKPVGGVTHFYIPSSQASHNATDGKVTINDINVRFSGSIRLEGGSGYRDYDINDLVENKEFVRRLFSRPDVINAIRNSMDAGINISTMNDPARMAGLPTSSTLFGKMMNT